jgi:hypothetical protein
MAIRDTTLQGTAVNRGHRDGVRTRFVLQSAGWDSRKLVSTNEFQSELTLFVIRTGISVIGQGQSLRRVILTEERQLRRTFFVFSNKIAPIIAGINCSTLINLHCARIRLLIQASIRHLAVDSTANVENVSVVWFDL